MSLAANTCMGVHWHTGGDEGQKVRVHMVGPPKNDDTAAAVYWRFLCGLAMTSAAAAAAAEVIPQQVSCVTATLYSIRVFFFLTNVTSFHPDDRCIQTPSTLADLHTSDTTNCFTITPRPLCSISLPTVPVRESSASSLRASIRHAEVKTPWCSLVYLVF